MTTATTSRDRIISAPHMTPLERKLYETGHSEECQGFTIVPKRDFGQHGYWSPEHRTTINAGWVITHGSGRFKGCNACPGATFAWTLQDARETVADLIAAGFTGHSDEVGGGGNSAEFWRLVQARHQAKKAAALPTCDRCGLPASDTQDGILALNGTRLVCSDCNGELDREHCAETGDIHPLDTLNPAAVLAAHFHRRRG